MDQSKLSYEGVGGSVQFSGKKCNVTFEVLVHLS